MYSFSIEHAILSRVEWIVCKDAIVNVCREDAHLAVYEDGQTGVLQRHLSPSSLLFKRVITCFLTRILWKNRNIAKTNHRKTLFFMHAHDLSQLIKRLVINCERDSAQRKPLTTSSACRHCSNVIYSYVYLYTSDGLLSSTSQIRHHRDYDSP